MLKILQRLICDFLLPNRKCCYTTFHCLFANAVMKLATMTKKGLKLEGFHSGCMKTKTERSHVIKKWFATMFSGGNVSIF